MTSKTGLYRRRIARYVRTYGGGFYCIKMHRLDVCAKHTGFIKVAGQLRFVSSSIHARINRRVGLEITPHYYTYQSEVRHASQVN